MQENLLMPVNFFEVEHSTDIQNSLLKYKDLQDFTARMIILADESRKREFESKITSSAFESIIHRVKFLEYEALVKMYNFTIEEQYFKTKL